MSKIIERIKEFFNKCNIFKEQEEVEEKSLGQMAGELAGNNGMSEQEILEILNAGQRGSVAETTAFSRGTVLKHTIIDKGVVQRTHELDKEDR